MSRRVRRVLQEVPRKYPGEKQARRLIRWVNNSDPRDAQTYYRERITAASRKRAVVFLEHVQGLITRIEASVQEDLECVAGHGSIAISARYVHPFEDAVLEAMERLGGHNSGHNAKAARLGKRGDALLTA
jgi:hypothetical protein